MSDEVWARGEEERIGVGGGQLDVGGVEAVGEVEEEAVGGEEEGVGGGGGEGRDDGGDLEHRGAVLAGDALVGVHGQQELEQHPRRERRHGCWCAPGSKWGEIWGRSGLPLACVTDVRSERETLEGSEEREENGRAVSNFERPACHWRLTSSRRRWGPYISWCTILVGPCCLMGLKRPP